MGRGLTSRRSTEQLLGARQRREHGDSSRVFVRVAAAGGAGPRVAGRCWPSVRRVRHPDFEAVLRLLWHAELVNAALRVTSGPITRAYHGVRQALIETVRSTHLPFADVRDSPFAKPHESVLGTKRDFLTTFQLVVSLNYDLLAYWAVMSARRPFLDDCFRPEGEDRRIARARPLASVRKRFCAQARGPRLET